jgi:hypothetical protein
LFRGVISSAVGCSSSDGSGVTVGLRTVLFVALWLLRGGWAESVGVSAPTWVRTPDRIQDDEVLGEGPLTWKRDLILPAPGREETREDRSDIPLSSSGFQRRLTALNREVTRLLDAHQVDVIELTELARRRRIEDQWRLVWDWVQAIDQQRTDRAAELRLLEGVNAFDASVHGPMEAPSLPTRSSRMEPQRQEYKGHRIELRAREGATANEPELLIDDEPVRYGRLPDGQYALHEYAFDWSDDLMDLARRFIDYRDRANEIRRQAEPR